MLEPELEPKLEMSGAGVRAWNFISGYTALVHG